MTSSDVLSEEQARKLTGLAAPEEKGCKESRTACLKEIRPWNERTAARDNRPVEVRSIGSLYTIDQLVGK